MKRKRSSTFYALLHDLEYKIGATSVFRSIISSKATLFRR